MENFSKLLEDIPEHITDRVTRESEEIEEAHEKMHTDFLLDGGSEDDIINDTEVYRRWVRHKLLNFYLNK